MPKKNQDTRWIQRLDSYKKALSNLEEFIEAKTLNKLEEQGLVKAFEYTYELAWNLLKDYLEFQGYSDLTGSRDTIRAAFKAGLISDGDLWMDMLGSRNKTSHTYNQETTKEINKAVTNSYINLFRSLLSKMDELNSQS